MMKHILSVSLLSVLIIACNKQTKAPTENTLEISSSNLKEHVEQLASDAFEGRGAGYEGEKETTKYIANIFNELELESFQKQSNDYRDYFQPFDFLTLASPNPWETLTSQNVVGYIQGETQQEYIVVGGHHDGQGMKGQAMLGRDIAEGEATDPVAALKDTIWNSAVDNAVSIAVVLEIARVLKESNTKLKRSIILVTFGAEESGLDGSIYFVNNPVVTKQHIKAMVNLEKIVGDPDADFLYVSYGTNSIFEDIRKSIDTLSTIKLKPFYPGMIADTDHYAFAQRKIPAITIGTGSMINVHTALDHADRIDYELLKKRSQYILKYLIELSNSDGNFAFEGDMSGLLGVSGGPATTAEKLLKKFDGVVAFKVTSVVKDSKGYHAGLIPGDLIIAIDHKPIPYQTFYQGLEDVIGTTDKKSVPLKVIRENKTVLITITMD